MKLWEVIKALTEDPTKKFVLDEGDRNYTLSVGEGCFANYFNLSAIDGNGANISNFDSGQFDGNFTTDEDDWQLVRQPVTWQEAIQAWYEGKKAVWEGDGERRVFDRNNSWLGLKHQAQMIDQDGDAVTVRMISGGEWYVED